jgi:hypothetical protein
MNAQGDLLGSPKGRGVDAFDAFVSALARIDELKPKAEKGDKAAAFDLVIAEMEIGSKTFAAATEAVKALEPLDAAQKAKWEAVALEAEVSEAFASMRVRDPEEAKAKQEAVAAKFREMKKAGRIPKGDSATMFWHFLCIKSVEAKDKAAAKEAYDHLEKALEKDEATKNRVLPQLKKRLDEL